MAEFAMVCLAVLSLGSPSASAETCTSRGVSVQILGSGGAVVDVTKGEASTVLDRGAVTVTAMTVSHGAVPALAYRIHALDSSIVFSGDQVGTDPRFVEFAREADVLVTHLAIGAGESSPPHASPATVGQVARKAGVGRLVLSHLGPGVVPGRGMLQPELDLEPAVAEVKRHSVGPVTLGTDLQCTLVR